MSTNNSVNQSGVKDNYRERVCVWGGGGGGEVLEKTRKLWGATPTTNKLIQIKKLDKSKSIRLEVKEVTEDKNLHYNEWYHKRSMSKVENKILKKKPSRMKRYNPK